MLKAFAKLAVLVALVSTLQLAVHMASPSRGVPSAVKLCATFLDEGRDLIYFGDSTLYRGAEHEEAPETLPEKVDRLLEGYTVGAIAHDAYNTELYLSFVRFIAQREKRPRAIIIPIHLRSFSVERDQRPEYQFEREHYFLNHDTLLARAFFRPLASFRAIDLTPVTPKEHLRMSAFDGERYLGTVGELLPSPEEALEGAVLTDFVRLCYYNRIRSDHRQLVALKSLNEVCREADIRVVVYLTPLDVALGDEMMGREFSERVGQNASTIVSVLEQLDVPYVDMTEALDHSFFAQDLFPDAYLTAEGKQWVADEVAALVRGALD